MELKLSPIEDDLHHGIMFFLKAAPTIKNPFLFEIKNYEQVFPLLPAISCSRKSLFFIHTIRIGLEFQSAFSMHPQNAKENFNADSTVILSGPGNVKHRKEKHLTAVQWQVRFV